VLIRPENREIKRQYRTIGQNTQAMQMRWECISEDKRKKEWITHGAQNDRQLGKIVKKKEKKILVEHWQMQSKESELAIEINRCKGCIRVEEHQEDSCQQWIRVNNRINVVPDALIKKGSNKIKIPIDQITETIKTSRLVIEEQKLEGLRIVEEPEVEIVRQQKLKNSISQEIIEVLRRNITRNKTKYIIYTDGAANLKTKEDTRIGNSMGIGWVQTDEMQEWPEEELALGLEGWQTSTIAELVAIWAAILTIPRERQIEIYTDSNAAIRNISRGLEQVCKDKILKKKNTIWIMKIRELIRTKNIQRKLVKVKSYSKDRWNDKADSLAKKGATSKKIIQVGKVNYEEIEYCLE
jgi:ribonuclease HI